MSFDQDRNPVAAILIIIVSLLVLGVGVLKCSANYDGSAQAKATAEAQTFAQEVSPGARVSCAGGDSDNDGYVSCTVVPQGDHAGVPFSIQCTSSYALSASGCKLTPAVTNPQNLR